MNKNKIDEAKANLQKIARFNCKELSDEEMDICKQTDTGDLTQYSFHSLVKTPRMRTRTILMCYIW